MKGGNNLELQEKKHYRIRSRKKEMYYVSFSKHARQRLDERCVNMLDVIVSLSVHSEELAALSEKGEILFMDDNQQLSVLLSVSESDGGGCHFNVITILNAVPRDEQGKPRFKVEAIVQAS